MSRLTRMPSTLSFANVMSMIAVFIALGGTGYAAVSISGKDVKNNSLTGADIRNASLTGADVRNGSLRSADFAAGQLPKGNKGEKGDKGDRGEKGEIGAAVDASKVVRGDGSPQLWSYIRDWGRSGIAHPLPDVAGLGTLTYNCAEPNDTGHATLTFNNALAERVLSSATTATGSTSTTTTAVIVDHGSVTIDIGGAEGATTTWQLSPNAFFEPGTLTTLTITHAQYGAGCSVRVQALSQDPQRPND